MRVTCRGWQRASGCRSRAGGGLRGIHASHVHVAVPTQWFDAAHLYSWLLRVNPALRSCGPAVLRSCGPACRAGLGCGAGSVNGGRGECTAGRGKRTPALHQPEDSATSLPRCHLHLV